MGNVKASIVIPLYNKKDTILRAIDSVLAQAEGDFELLVVDDGSRDGGAELVATRQDVRIRLIRQENAGASAARNRGVREAKAEWVAFLDADDRYEAGFLDACLRAARQEPAAIAVFTNLLLEQGGGSHPAIAPHRGNELIEDYASWFVAHKGRGLSSSSSMVKRQALLDCGGFPEKVLSGEDTDTWFRLSWLGPFVYVPEVLAAYDLGAPGSLSARSGPVYPAVCQTIDRALAEGRLREPKARSARKARRFFVQAYAASLALYGQRGRAALFLLKAPPSPATLRKWLRGLYALAFKR